MNNQGKAFKILSLKNVWIPVFIGILVSIYLAHKKLSNHNISSYDWQSFNYKPFVFSIILIVIRDIFFSFRLSDLTENKLKFSKYLRIIILWDFAAAVTPSVLGGSVVSVFLLTREGINLGRSLAVMIVTTIFDNLFFLVVSPLGYWVAYNKSNDFAISESGKVGAGLKLLFAIGVSIVLIYTLVVSISMWYKPKFFKWLLFKVCTKVKFLKKWRYVAIKHGNEMMSASDQFRDKPFSFWLRVFLYTAIAIACKYGVLNCVISCVRDLSFSQNLVVIGNQVLLWKVMLLSPTPGSTGTAEIFFSLLFSDLLQDSVVIIQILWRFITYYLQIIVGAVVLSRFFKTAKV